jgi:hypothetical protein
MDLFRQQKNTKVNRDVVRNMNSTLASLASTSSSAAAAASPPTQIIQIVKV